MDQDSKSTTKVVPLVVPGSYDADIAAVKITLKDFNSLLICTHVGVGGITFTTNNKVEYQLTKSDDDTTYVPVTAADVIMPHGETLGADGIIRSLTAAKAAADAEIHAVGYVGKSKFLKFFPDFSGSHASPTPMSAFAVFGAPKHAPLHATSIEE